MESNGFVWLLIGPYEFSCVLMVTYRSLIHLYKSLRALIGLYWLLWISMGTYGSLCVLWVHMGFYKSFCVFIDFNGFLFVFNKSLLNAFFIMLFRR